MKRFIILLLIILSVLFVSGCETSIDSAHVGSENEHQSIETSDDKSSDEENVKSLEYKSFCGFETDKNPLNTVNIKEFIPSIFCFYGDIAYFSWEGCVYEYNTNTEVLTHLFEGNAYDLNYSNGYLYYIINDSYDVNNGDRVHISGKIYRYNISAKQNELVYNYPVSNLIVADDEIIYTEYSKVGDEFPTGIFKFNEQTNSSVRLYNGWTYIEHNNFTLRFISDKGNTKYFFSDGNDNYLLEDVYPSFDCIVNDDYYYVSSKDGTLNRFSMLSGEKTVSLQYDKDEILDDSHKLFSLSDYTVFNGEIFFADSNLRFCRYDELSEKINIYESDYAFMYLYTDGKNIYSVVKDYLEHKCYFAKLAFVDSVVEVDIII